MDTFVILSIRSNNLWWFTVNIFLNFHLLVLLLWGLKFNTQGIHLIWTKTHSKICNTQMHIFFMNNTTPDGVGKYGVISQIVYFYDYFLDFGMVLFRLNLGMILFRKGVCFSFYATAFMILCGCIMKCIPSSNFVHSDFGLKKNLFYIK